MRKLTLLLAILAVAAAPSIADAKSKAKKRTAAPAAAAKADANEPGRRLVGEAFHQLVVPLESMAKSSASQQQATAKPTKARKAKRTGKKKSKKMA